MISEEKKKIIIIRTNRKLADFTFAKIIIIMYNQYFNNQIGG